MFKRHNILISVIFVSFQITASDPATKDLLLSIAAKANAAGDYSLMTRPLRDKQESKAVVLKAAEKGIELVRRKYDKRFPNGTQKRYILTVGKRLDREAIKHYCERKMLDGKYLLIVGVDEMLELEPVDIEKLGFSAFLSRPI